MVQADAILSVEQWLSMVRELNQLLSLYLEVDIPPAVASIIDRAEIMRLCLSEHDPEDVLLVEELVLMIGELKAM